MCVVCPMHPTTSDTAGQHAAVKTITSVSVLFPSCHRDPLCILHLCVSVLVADGFSLEAVWPVFGFHHS